MTVVPLFPSKIVLSSHVPNFFSLCFVPLFPKTRLMSPCSLQMFHCSPKPLGDPPNLAEKNFAEIFGRRPQNFVRPVRSDPKFVKHVANLYNLKDLWKFVIQP